VFQRIQIFFRKINIAKLAILLRGYTMNIEEEIVKKLENLSIKEILGYAIASEEDAEKFYSELATKLGGLLKEFFTQLSTAERGHKEILLRIYKSKFGDENYPVPEGIPFAETTIKVETVRNLIEAMKIALTNEKTAERVYKYLAEKMPEHREIFKFLATQERSHYESLRAHKEFLEDTVESKPEYIEAPPTYISSQLEIPFGPEYRGAR